LGKDAGEVGEAVVFKVDSFVGEEAEFSGQGGAGGFALEATRGEVGRDDAVAGDLGSERIGAEGLADGAGGAATETAGQSGVGDDSAGCDFAHGGIDAEGEGGRRVYSFQRFSG